MNKLLRKIVFFLLVLTMFNGIAKAQTYEPFTFTVEKVEKVENPNTNCKTYVCKQDNEKDGCKITYEWSEIEIYDKGKKGVLCTAFFKFELDLDKVTLYKGVFPTDKESGTIYLMLSFENSQDVVRTCGFHRKGQMIVLEGNLNNFFNSKDPDSRIEAETLLPTFLGVNISMFFLFFEQPGDWWMWEMNTFKTAPTLTAMAHRIVQAQGKQGDANVNTNNEGNSLSKGAWRTHMRKVLDYVTKRTTNGAYKGQIYNGSKYGYGVYWWKEGDYLFGYWSNNRKTGYGIYIYGDGYEMENCPECVYFVGYSVKSDRGACYDKYGNLIYFGDFSNGRPTGTYPTTDNYSSYKFECKEYDGDRYIGETYKGQRHGQGIYIWKNGDAWYGSWKDGKREGDGILLYYEGKVKYGKWIADKYKN